MTLQRMVEVEVARRVPVVRDTREQHSGVLSRAVHPDGGRGIQVTNLAVAGFGIRRARGRAAQGILGQSGLFEDGADDADMAIGAGVTRGGEAEPLALEFDARREHPDGLQRLETRAGEERRLPIAEGGTDRAVGREYDRDATVPRFDEAAAIDGGDFDGARNGEGS